MTRLTTEQPRFIDTFSAFWKTPSPEHVSDLIYADVVLRQPLSPPLRGINAARRALAQLLRALPDLTVQPTHCYTHPQDPQRLVIECEFAAHIGQELFRWDAADVVILRGDRATARTTPPAGAGAQAHRIPSPILHAGLAHHPRQGFTTCFSRSFRREFLHAQRTRAGLAWAIGLPIALRLNPIDKRLPLAHVEP